MQLRLVDEICRLAKLLDSTSRSVRKALRAGKLDELDSLRKDFDSIRDETLKSVQKLAQHRLDHHSD